jgi:hypothetical protein
VISARRHWNWITSSFNVLHPWFQLLSEVGLQRFFPQEDCKFRLVQSKRLSAEEKKKRAGFCEHSLLSSVVDRKELKAF